MQYQKIVLGDTIIEFHNNWLGEETVILNGQIVSKKSSVWGTNHYFTMLDDGHQSRFILTTKVDPNMQIKLDLSKDGTLIREDVPVKYNSSAIFQGVKAKMTGLAKLKKYDLQEAIIDFKQALEETPRDGEIYFHMACAYSVLEQTQEGFEALQKAVQFNLQNQEMILNHDMLAFLRMQSTFEGFLASGFKHFDLGKDQD